MNVDSELRGGGSQAARTQQGWAGLGSAAEEKDRETEKGGGQDSFEEHDQKQHD